MNMYSKKIKLKELNIQTLKDYLLFLENYLKLDFSFDNNTNLLRVISEKKIDNFNFIIIDVLGSKNQLSYKEFQIKKGTNYFSLK